MKSDAILIFTNTIPRFILDFSHFVDYLAQSGFGSTFYAPRQKRETSTWMYKEDVVAEWIQKLPPGTGVESLPFDRERPTLLAVLRTMRFTWQRAKQNPDCIAVFWTIIPILVCGLPMRVRNVRCVFMVTGLGSAFSSYSLKFRIVRPLIKLLYRYLFKTENSRVIVHNREDKQYLIDALGVKAEHIQVTEGCGADPKAFPFFDELPGRSKKVILVPSRLVVEKGILDAAEASSILRDRGVEHEMWFTSTIDSGNPSTLNQDDLDRLEHENDYLKFLGYQPTMAPMYKECDLVCLPSWYREGLPSPLIEAAACGRPAVACNIVGSRDIIEDGVTGLMVPPRSPKALANALQQLMADDELSEKLRQNAFKQYLDKFTKDDMVSKTVNVFRSLGLDVPEFDP